MKQITLEADIRQGRGKSCVKHLRKGAVIPCVVYGKGKGTVPVQVKADDINRILKTSGGENVLINLKLKEQTEEKTVIIKEIQYDPVYGKLLHLDFNQISLTEKLKVNVPIVAKGESVGVKEGGLLQHIMWEVEIECLPTQIPEKIDVDVSNLKIGDSVQLKDLKIPEDIRLLQDPGLIVISVASPVEEKPEEAVPTEAAVVEPEVIREKKPVETAEDTKEKQKEK